MAAKKLLLNRVKRNYIIEQVFKTILMSEPCSQYKEVVNNLTKLLEPFILSQYNQEDMKVLQKYGCAWPIGQTLQNHGKTVLHVHFLEDKPHAFDTFQIDFDLGGYLFPTSYEMRKCDQKYLDYNSEHMGLSIHNYDTHYIIRTYSQINIPVDLRDEYIKYTKTISDIIGSQWKTFNNYKKLILISKSFDDLVDVNPHFEKYREWCENYTDKIIKQKLSKEQGRCIMSEDQLKAILDNPIEI